jgi:hypothetical protein
VVSIFSQNAILIISLFKKKFFQSNNQHRIVCLILPQNSCWCERFSMLSKGLFDLAQAFETFLLVSY